MPWSLVSLLDRPDAPRIQVHKFSLPTWAQHAKGATEVFELRIERLPGNARGPKRQEDATATTGISIWSSRLPRLAAISPHNSKFKVFVVTPAYHMMK